MLRALSVDYWKQLNPDLSVCSTSTIPFGGNSVGREMLETEINRLKIEGWCQIEDFFSPVLVRQLAAAVLKLDQEGWPPTYVCVYDEFWQIVRSGPFKLLLKLLLGTDYMQKVAVWVHLTHPHRGLHGWSPHRDAMPAEGNSVNEDGSARLLSVWLPLTDVTPDNGCIYVIPKDRILNLLEANGQGELEPNFVKTLHASQALPMKAGTFACWTQDVLHWGSYCSGHSQTPRISLAMEFQQKAEANPSYYLIEGDYVPLTLNERLLFISHQVMRYLRQWEPQRASPEQLQLAESLCGRFAEKSKGWIQMGRPRHNKPSPAKETSANA